MADLYCVDVEDEEVNYNTKGLGGFPAVMGVDDADDDQDPTGEQATDPTGGTSLPGQTVADIIRDDTDKKSEGKKSIHSERDRRTTISSPASVYSLPSAVSSYCDDDSQQPLQGKKRMKKAVKGLIRQQRIENQTTHISPFYRAFVTYVARKPQLDELNRAANPNAEKLRWIHPDSQAREVHTWACIIAILYNLICAPLRFGWNIPTSTVWLVFDLFTDLLLWMDIALTFIAPAGKSNEKLLLVSYKERIKAYLKSGFIFHLIGTLPLEYFIPNGHNWRLTRLVYLRQVVALQNHRRVSSLNPAVYRILVFSVVLVVFIHIGACSWYRVALQSAPVIPVQALDAAGNPKLYILSSHGPGNYVRALFFAIVYLVGYNAGIPTALNYAQVLFGLGIVITGASIFATVIGTVGVILRQLDSNQQYFRDKVEQVNNFMKYSSIPDYLRRDVRHYYKHMWESRRGLEQLDALRELPDSLHREMMVFLHSNFVKEVDLFKNCSKISLEDICCMLEYVAVLPGYLIIKKGEVGREMYFILRGTVQVVIENADGDEVVVATLNKGFFGEVALVSPDAKRTASIRAQSAVELYKLAKMDLDLIMEQYPETKDSIMSVAEARDLLKKPAPESDDADDENETVNDGNKLTAMVSQSVSNLADLDALTDNDSEIDARSDRKMSIASSRKLSIASSISMLNDREIDLSME